MLGFLLPAALAVAVTPAYAAGGPEDLFRNGHFFGELRYRYEHVDKDGFAMDARANTLRADLGFETGLWMDFTALVDFQTVQHIGDDDFDDTENGNTSFPIIADPDRHQFRQAWIMWTGIDGVAVRGGRQEITYDNQRFVGNVDFRQNDLTFDAAAVSWSPVSDLTFDYAYIWNINRISGPDYTGHTHLLHGAYEYADWLRLAAYGYAVDLNQKPLQSSRTFGGQARGEKAVTDDLELGYLIEYASQSDYTDNPDNFDLRYFHVTPSVFWKDFTLQAGFESFEGNGTDAFQTPLATLHAFNGWADLFLTTPAEGLEDRYGRFTYRVSGLGWIDGLAFDVLYHDFDAENTSADYGTEWDFQIRKSFETRDFLTKEWNLSAKYAAYEADTFGADTNKFWLTVGTKF
ncbi:MAG: alginate export family protein [Alphaproteobacteria bacterium]